MSTQLDISTADTVASESSVPETPDSMVPTCVVVCDEAVARSQTLLCMKCKLQVDPLRAIVKSKSKLDPAKSKMQRKLCNAAQTMLVRSMQWPPQRFSELDDQDQMHFWQACRETVSDDSRFVYSKVRACLVKSLTSRKVIEDSVDHFSDWKPLSVWEKEGYAIPDIEARGRQEPHAVFGAVWSFPQKRVSTKCTLQTVEEHVQRAEQSVKAKKLEQDDVEVDDDFDALQSSDDEPPNKKAKSSGSQKAKKGKGGRAKASNAEKAAAKAEAARAKKEKEKLQKQNASVQTFATKCLAVVTAPLMECTMAYDVMVGSLSGKFAQNVMDLVKNARDELAAMKQEASAVTSEPRSCQDALELEFDQKGVVRTIRAAKDALKTFNDMSRIVNR